MQVRTDDEVYRVDAVWLGPPKATLPFRARYVSWGIGFLIFLLVLLGQHEIGIGLGFFQMAWGLVITVALTKVIGSRINHERPLTAVVAMWVRELVAPREKKTATGGAASADRIRVSAQRPRPPARPSAVIRPAEWTGRTQSTAQRMSGSYATRR